MDFYTRRSLYKESLLSFLGAQCDLHLLTEMHGNIGDHLIWAGTRDLSRSAGVGYMPLPLHEVEIRPPAKHPVDTRQCGVDQILARMAACRRHQGRRAVFTKSIILPSSFDLSVPIVAECLSQHNVYAFARETRSYRSVKSLGRAALSWILRSTSMGSMTVRPPLQDPSDDSSLLLALREDKESLLPGQGLAPNPVMNQDISLTKANLDDWIDAITRASTVVTDRLHVAVASVLFGKRLIYMDPDRLKISNYFNYTFRNTFDGLIRRCPVEWLVANKFVVKGGL